MSKPLILIGYFQETIELCEKAQYEIIGIVDRVRPLECKYKYIGDDNFLINNAEQYLSIPLFLVPDVPKVRKMLYLQYKEKGFHFETIISPNAIISQSAQIDEGCMVQDGCNISSNVRLGKCVRVNSLANIMHDSQVHNFSTIAPSSVVLGKCIIGELTFIGANATILPYKTIGRGGW